MPAAAMYVQATFASQHEGFSTADYRMLQRLVVPHHFAALTLVHPDFFSP
jgi:hypothetical protein